MGTKDLNQRHSKPKKYYCVAHFAKVKIEYDFLSKSNEPF